MTAIATAQTRGLRKWRVVENSFLIDGKSLVRLLDGLRIVLTSVVSSSTGPKPKILSYFPGFKKSSEEPGAKDDKTRPTPTVDGSESNSDDSLSKRASHTSQDFDLRLFGPKDEPLIAAHVSSTKRRDKGSQIPTKHMRGTHTNPTESPLKRPDGSSAIAKPVETRLKRPKDSTEDISFSDTIATFAVDTSGSTGGVVLQEEKNAIKTLCEGLAYDAFTQARIIPWSHEVHSSIGANELGTLVSEGGTEPSRLNVSHGARTALSRCSAWFLLTDGEIDHQETRAFSQGISGTGLHGIPCVVILFGYKASRPIGCNISVGLAVFSNAADCLFLFHDIDTTQVYILQSKGVFNAVLPSGSHKVALDSGTLWRDIPLFTYHQLFDLALPARQQLQSNELLLQSGHKINLQDLYLNQIDSSTTGEILANNDNLQLVLLAAQLRGDDDNIRKWILEQSPRGSNILLRERPDINRQAARTMRALLSLLARPNSNMDILVLQHDLRTAHHDNWVKFVSDLRAEYHESSARSTVVSSVIERIDSNRRDMNGGLNSPSLLSPVPGVLEPPTTPRLKNSHIPVRSSAGLPSEIMDNFDLPTSKSMLTGENAGALYIQQYQCRPGDSIVEGTCPICEECDVVLVFLLKSPPTDITTPNFPQPNDRKGLAYPLAMGTYPETDILSSQLCCDSCAHTLVQGKMEYDGDEVTAAIPLMQSAFSGEYQLTTLGLVDTALEKRFQKSSVELVLLAIIHGTLANLDGKNLRLRSAALIRASCWIAEKTNLPMSLSMSITGSTAQSEPSFDPMPMIEVLKVNIKNVEQPESPLLQYPIGGFVVLMLTMEALNRVALVKACQLAVWHRFLFHLVERHCALLASNQPQAIEALRTMLTASSADTDPAGAANGDDRPLKPIAETPNESRERTELPEEPRDVSTDSPVSTESKVPSVGLSTVYRTHLLSEEDLEEFERLGKLFEPVKDLCSAALHSFLKCLSQQALEPSLAIDVFDKMRAQEDLHDVFVIPDSQEKKVYATQRGGEPRRGFGPEVDFRAVSGLSSDENDSDA